MAKWFLFTFMSETGSRHTVRAASERSARARLAYENPGINFTLYHREPAAGENDE